MRKYLSYLPLIILLLFIIIISAATTKLNQKQNLSTINNDSLPIEDFEIKNLYPGKVNLRQEDLIGHYSIINFFASWCTGCAAEHDFLMSLKSEGKFKIYGVAWRDFDQKTKEFINNYGNPYNLILKDTKGEFGQRFNIKAIPESLFIDPKGRIIIHHQGVLNEAVINQITIN